ncbi:hypothetical protein DY000_02009325 [Brassica cretica]|uniref:Plant methyltransferase dimerisation domain-containing protein n=1 Tax=Brassica cretica TaxID=69181 RepID=A0ABQ7CJT1_BRACR|nr:hypothetical protein DY000_02009325 [Brassica cretica]
MPPRLRHRISSSPSHLCSLSRLRWQGGAASEAAAAKLIKRRKLASFSLAIDFHIMLRAGMEMAMIDAASKSVGVPLALADAIFESQETQATEEKKGKEKKADQAEGSLIFNLYMWMWIMRIMGSQLLTTLVCLAMVLKRRLPKADKRKVEYEKTRNSVFPESFTSRGGKKKKSSGVSLRLTVVAAV